MQEFDSKQKNDKKSVNNIFPLNQGKIPPQAIDLEEYVLGAMMIDKKGVDEVIDLLQADAFYKEAHRYIFDAIRTLFENTQPIDLITVADQLKKDKKLNLVGGEFYLIQLSKKITSSAHIEYHARIILQQYVKRCLISVSSEIIEQAYDPSVDVIHLLDDAETRLYDVTQGNIKNISENAQSLVLQAKKKIEEIANKKGVSGVSTGFSKLDEITSGWQNSDLIIIAARPGMGKTALSLSMARNIAVENQIPAAIFSLEMSSLQLITRLISSETGLSSVKLRTGKLQDHEWEQLNVKVKDLEKAPLYIDDSPSLSIFDLRAKARRLASQFGIKIIFIDYLQLMSSTSSSKFTNREQEISTISRNLKALAKELDIPIVALSQLSRAVETRGGTKRPLLSDLRESGAIEQDADIVSFIYRPEYYKIEEWDDDSRTPTEGQAELIIAKHRNGGLDEIRLKFIGGLGKFENLDSFGFVNEFESKINTSKKDNITSKLDIPPSPNEDIIFDDRKTNHDNKEDSDNPS